jgi:hypothetical protein
VRNVNAAWKREDATVAPALGFVQALAACEHQIRSVHQLRLLREKLGRSPAKRRQLVHAIEHDRTRRKIPGELKRHRRVVPDDRLVDSKGGLQLVQKSPQFAGDGRPRQTFGKMGYANVHALIT